jgi:argininosuccinate synthase
MPRYAELIYNGFWFAPEREMLQALIDKSQEHVDRRGAAEALQGQRHRRRPQRFARSRSTTIATRTSSPSRTTAS